MDTERPVDVSVVIPAFNEAERLPEFLRSLAANLKTRSYSSEIIIVDDGSNRADAQVYRKAVEIDQGVRVRLIRFEKNQGKGAAVRRGFAESRGRWIGFVDADGATPSGEIVRLADFATQSRDYSGIFASRIRLLGYSIHRKLSRHLMGRAFVSVAHNLLYIPFYDPQCGCKFFLRKDIMDFLSYCKEKGFLFDIELIAYGYHSGLRFLEVPIDWTDVPGTKVRIARDSLRMLTGLWRIRRRLRKHNIDVRKGKCSSSKKSAR